MPKISKKGQELPSSPIRKLVVHADTAKSRGTEVLHLNIGQPDIEAPEEAMEIVRQHPLKLLPYGSSQGSISYRTHLCDYYAGHNISVEPDDIIVTTGASEALSFTLSVICDAGDEIIIPEPFYANYNGFAAASSVEVVPVVSHFENQFKLPPVEKLEEKITSVLGNEILTLNFRCFDEIAARDSLKLYNSFEVPAIEKDCLSEDISKITFTSNLTKTKVLSFEKEKLFS